MSGRRTPVRTHDLVEHPDQVEERTYTSTAGPSTMGRSVVYIRCPFCEVRLTAYLWSLAGGGKRCDCGAFLNAYGTAIAWRAEE